MTQLLSCGISGHRGDHDHPPCTTLELTGKAVELPSVPNSWQGRPRIHSLPDGRAGIVHGYSAQSGPKSAGLADTVVSWLGDWPPAFEAPIELDPDRGWSYAVDRGPAPHYAILAGTSAMPPGISHKFVNPAGS